MSEDLQLQVRTSVGQLEIVVDWGVRLLGKRTDQPHATLQYSDFETGARLR